MRLEGCVRRDDKMEIRETSCILCNDPGKKKEKRKKKKLSRRKTCEFFGDCRVSRTPRETTATPRPAFSPRLPPPIRIPAKGEKKENTREREISDKRRRVSSFSDEPSNHPKTNTKRLVTTTRRIPNESTITQGAYCAFS